MVPIILIAGLGYWRYSAIKQSLATPQAIKQDTGKPLEVPKTLPAASLEDTPATTVPQAASNLNSPDPRMQAVETAVADLKARVSALEKTTPAPVISQVSKYPLYIPLGSGGGPWTDQTWNTLSEYQVAINPDNYPGYSSMQLEANFRLTETAGTGSVRLYNVTDSSSISSQLDTTSASFGTQTSSTFKLPSGQKTYTIQVQSTQGKTLFVQSARIKVNF